MLLRSPFQSLFLWIFRSYLEEIRQLDKIINAFQSLFLWIFRSYNTMSLLNTNNNSSFNPCSYGSSVLTFAKIQNSARWNSVSILVLMDLPFLPVPEVNIIIFICVSILVLMDLPFLLRKSPSYIRSLKEVSILVLMDLPFLRLLWWRYKKSFISFNPCSYGSSVLTDTEQKL